MKGLSPPADEPALSLKAEVIETARAAGASSVRVTRADVDLATQRRFADSFARGDLATWPYDEAYARRASDPQSLLGGARSVVCVALAYATEQPAWRPLSGRISNYAWGGDYHVVMREILARISVLLDRHAGRSVTRILCDAAPFAERAFAQRAGIGWVGKHTNVIVPGAGSYVFLGEVLTQLELEPDEPVRKSCGTCVRCIDVCPTGALRGDYTIDATRCISDLTQRTGVIPRALRPLIGDWIWGCDLCQEVCPPTKRAGLADDERFAPAGARSRPSLVELLRMRSAEFRRRFARSAMGWRGAAVLRRNAAVALGNLLDRSTVAVLGDAAIRDTHPIVRGHAAWALGRIGSPLAYSILGRCRSREADCYVLEEIVSALEPCSVTGRS